MACELFIYWRVAMAQAAPAMAVATQMQRTLVARHIGLQARLYQRAEDGGADVTAAVTQVTLMETYARPGRDVDAALRAEIEMAAQALAAWCDGHRHVETFDAVPP